MPANDSEDQRQADLRDELRGFLIAAIQHEHDMVTALISHEREMREIGERMRDGSLLKQALEYERRLDELNHAHANATQDKHLFLLKVTYEAHVKDYDSFKSTILQRVAAETASQAASARLWAIGASVITAMVTAIVLYWTRGFVVAP